ncbi:hypothetical protein BC628DRAFT_509146 [Trametes gibbosa]|nr:hypothetical protein BC628DRAFT_509146 [Trametes gibbosa]
MSMITFDHSVVYNDVDDDDGMPPLVDNPLPPMTFTFTTETNHVIWNNEATTYEPYAEGVAPQMSVLSPPGTPMLGHARPSHAKKRDASYIPRPPNAFILFRSSFIRAQHIPGQIEGNHSALSKIIGKCWKALPREEREVWEAKAVVALDEHRQKYPDWRFKPAANALAKVKDGPRKRGNRKGRGQSEKEERSREKRCAKIADLLVAGKTGTDLAAAVEQYDCEVDRGRKPKEEAGGVSVGPPLKQRRVGAREDVRAHAADTMRGSDAVPNEFVAEGAAAKGAVPRTSADGRFGVPLTSMFKRSSSAPAPRARAPTPDMQQIAAQRRESVCGGTPYFARASSFGSFADTLHASPVSSSPREAAGEAANDSMSSGCLTFAASAADPLVLPRSADGGVGFNDVYTLNVAGRAGSSPLPVIEPELDGIDTPALSPIATPVAYGWHGESDIGIPTSISDLMGEVYAPFPSSYSSLEGWAGSPMPYQASPIISALPKVFDYVHRPISPGVMEKAFDAASCAVFGIGSWSAPFGVGVVGAAQEPYKWSTAASFKCDFALGYCRQGDF